jgi:hypothetical protein
MGHGIEKPIEAGNGIKFPKEPRDDQGRQEPGDLAEGDDSVTGGLTQRGMAAWTLAGSDRLGIAFDVLAAAWAGEFHVFLLPPLRMRAGG